MTHASAILNSRTQNKAGGLETLARCIDACFDCAEACTACADACLHEDSIKALVPCIHLNADCADVCEVTGKLLSRYTGGGSVVVLRHQLAACISACRACAAECEAHGDMHEHCRICAETCNACEQACQALIGDLEPEADAAAGPQSCCL